MSIRARQLGTTAHSHTSTVLRCSSTDKMKMAGAQRALCYWTCFILVLGLIGKTSATSGVSSYDQVARGCAECDNQFAVAALSYQNTFGLFSKAIDGAKYHCRKMDNVSRCYENCQAGSIYTYSSQNKGIFDLFYRDYCDPACYTAIMPFCYLKTFGSFDNSLTCSGSAMNNDLRDCLRQEFFEKQNCSSACTPGQRKALYLFMQLQIPCFFSYTTQINCYTSVQYCTEKYFGDSGSDYSGLTDPLLASSNNASCKYFSTDYINCLETAFGGTISFGESSSVTTYESPCQSTETEITFLQQFAETFLAAPFCKAKNTTLDAVCRAFITTTTARVTSASTATARPATTSTTTARPTTRTVSASVKIATGSTLGMTTAAEVPRTDASAATEYPDTASDNSTATAFDGDNSTQWLDFDGYGSSATLLAAQNSLLLHAATAALLLHHYFFSLF